MGPQFPISRIMHSGMLLQCAPDTTIAQAAARMADQAVSSILVVEGGRVAGIWTEHDALAVDFSDSAVLQQPVASVMSAPVATLSHSMEIGAAAIEFREQGRRHFLVVDDEDCPIGILSQTDMALNQGLEPYLRLREVKAVIPSPAVVVDGTMPVSAVARQMHSQHTDAVVVKCGKGLGILTERDIVRFIARHVGNSPHPSLPHNPCFPCTKRSH